MTRNINCVKLLKEAVSLPASPYPGELGERIHQNISSEAWSMWLSHQTMLINEYRLSLIEPQAREFLEKEMVKFLFGEGSDKPAEYIPPEE